MQLVLGNVQGELSPLEIGIHALGLIELGEIGQGRGNKGGIREYARLLGKQQPNVVSYRQGAEVLTTLGDDTILYHFIDKAAHLAHIHKAPQSVWPLLAKWLITPNGKNKTPSANLRRALNINRLSQPF